MDKMRLGRTNLMVTKSSFGALPLQRLSHDEAIKLLQMAYNSGMNFYDTARIYSDSEIKIGDAFSGIRNNIIISTKSMAADKATLQKNIETSLQNLKTDYIDLLLLHNPETLPNPNDDDSLYSGLLEAKKKGQIRHFGISNHRLAVAKEAVESGLYDAVQFPLNYLASDEDLSLINICKEKDIGVIAMKAMSGGLISNAAAAFAFLRQYDNVVPIWGIQRESELKQFMDFENNPPILSDELWQIINNDRRDLSGAFCRGCGYCQPCTIGIDITWCARMSLFLRRSPYQRLLTDEWKAKMELINECTNCGLCMSRCPYKLNTPELLKENLRDYLEFYQEHR